MLLNKMFDIVVTEFSASNQTGNFLTSFCIYIIGNKVQYS